MLQRPGDGDVGFCTQTTVLPQLHLYSALSYCIITGQMCQILTPLVFLFLWRFPCCIWFRTLFRWNTSKKISFVLTEVHKAKITLVKTYNLLKKPMVYNYPHKFIFAWLLTPEVRGVSSFWHVCEVNNPFILSFLPSIPLYVAGICHVFSIKHKLCVSSSCSPAWVRYFLHLTPLHGCTRLNQKMVVCWVCELKTAQRGLSDQSQHCWLEQSAGCQQGLYRINLFRCQPGNTLRFQAIEQSTCEKDATREINLIKGLFDKQGKCLDFEQAKKKKLISKYLLLSVNS